ncbi:MAG: pentapeptide repeat-containing protein [Chitinophagales bacterium]|nr:pentapeptide repeat-containing protein [Chitinophagales bacterium]
MLETVFYYSGIVLWIVIIVWTILRLAFGEAWMLKVGGFLFLGSGLMQSAKKLKNEIKEKDIKDDTLTEVAVRIFWRLTRLGLIGLIIAGIPVWLLLQQNQLIEAQNKLFQYQNEKVTQQTHLLNSQDEKLGLQNKLFASQNDLFTDQNQKIDTQTSLFEDQNLKIDIQSELFRDQNYLIELQKIQIDSQINLLAGQNSRIDTQNYRVNIQNNLLEADRRSSLVFLMSNILDEVANELVIQGKDSKKELSQPLINRIIALSRAFTPYRVLQGDSLSLELVSPERGQLFIALLANHLDSLTQNSIVSNGNFSNAVIGNIAIPKGQFENAKLNQASFNTSLNDYYSQILEDSLSILEFTRMFNGAIGSNIDLPLNKEDVVITNIYGESYPINIEGLIGPDFRRANFKNANLENSKLNFAFLNYAILKRANMSGAKLRGAILSNANLDLAVLDNADLLHAFLFKATYNDAIFNQANLKGGDLRYSNAFGAKFINANLTNANFKKANLRHSDFSNANMESANLEDTVLDYVIFENTILRNCSLKRAKGLTYNQLLLSRSLYNCEGLDNKIRTQLTIVKPCLFTPEGCPKE